MASWFWLRPRSPRIPRFCDQGTEYEITISERFWSVPSRVQTAMLCSRDKPLWGRFLPATVLAPSVPKGRRIGELRLTSDSLTSFFESSWGGSSGSSAQICLQGLLVSTLSLDRGTGQKRSRDDKMEWSYGASSPNVLGLTFCCIPSLFIVCLNLARRCGTCAYSSARAPQDIARERDNRKLVQISGKKVHSTRVFQCRLQARIAQITRTAFARHCMVWLDTIRNEME
ncbi:hypothetical protein SELMODRAFT_412579 [Selaginella moellendorffii]|uniref:Uncharacterized protein n=1 Tax=Selaginella moellendorffii TaxID=88036 RepID=D8RLY1_SELML|nr:hypothetical protein SELMODRAFT_412579 [Selaginella moellendorffii]